MKLNFLARLFLSLLIIGTANIDVAAQHAAYYRVKVGQMEVTALSDGTVPVDAEKLLHSEEHPGKVARLLHSAHLHNPVEVSITGFLIRTGAKLILVDAGAGELFGPNYGGHIVSSLQAAGYQPSQITDILITHIHADHSGGLTVRNKMVFPNAVIHVNKLDTDYWLDEKRMENADSASLSSNKTTFINAIKVFRPYLAAGRVKTFEGNVDLFPGIRSIATPGHTPGHTIYMLESEGSKLVFWGDLIHVGGVQLADPTIRVGFDVDEEKGIAQRLKMYGEAAEQGYIIAADHLSYPGFGRLKTRADGYEWMPVPYSLEGRTE
jgi:glyoxylase-like metal-dependent hydrolase (beta-lactamase superfamily II)